MKKILFTILSFLFIFGATHVDALIATPLNQGGTGWATSTQGDLLVGTSSISNYSRLPIGSGVLLASTTSPFKMAWVATSSLGISQDLSNYITGATNSTLTETGQTLGLNLTNANTWTGLQTLSNTSGDQKISIMKGTVAPAFTDPTTIANLYAWWKADSLSLNDGDLVATWTDSSGNGRSQVQATDAKKPTYKTNIQNGKPGVLFPTTANSGMSYAGDPGVTQTTFIVYSRVSAFSYYQRAIQNAGGNGPFIGPNNGTHTYYNGRYITGTSITNNVPIIATVIQQGPQIDTFYQDGTSKGFNSQNGSGSGYPNGVGLSAGGSGYNEPMNGYIFEVLIYSRALNDFEKAEVEQYLSNKWNISVSSSVLQGNNYLEIQDPSGNVLSKFDYRGALTVPTGGLTVGTNDLVFNSGFIGVGTALPQAPFVVSKTQTLDVMPTSIMIQDPVTPTQRMYLGYNPTLNVGEIGTVRSGSVWLSTVFHRQNGNVGIGSQAAPTARLQVDNILGNTGLTNLVVLGLNAGSAQNTDFMQIKNTSTSVILSKFDSLGRLGIGLGATTPSAFIHVVGTTTQQRLGYDASNYFDATVGSTGGVAFDAVGSGAKFSWADKAGFGSTTPISTVSIKGTTATNLFTVASSTDAIQFEIDSKGHIYQGGSTPGVSSCGTSPSVIAGNDNVGRVQVGSVLATSCQIDFATSWDTPPACDANVEGGVTTGVAASSTRTSVVFTGASALTGNVFTYTCVGIR